MTQASALLTPATRTRVRRLVHGPSGQHEVRVVDGFFCRPGEVRRHALGLSFRPDRGNYPGERAPAGPATDEIAASVERLIGRDLDRSSVRVAFSMVTRRGVDLAPHQRTPHSDRSDVAGVVYLNPPGDCRGGTAFYRHRPSGFSAMPDEATPAVIGVMRRHGLWTLGQLTEWIMTPPTDGRRGFVTASNADWALTTLVRMRFNRLVLYHGRLFHSGYIADGWFGEAPAHRRLTLNLFANFATRRQP